jgi:hypothetical protein
MLPLMLSLSMGLLLEQPVPESLQRTVRTFDFEESTRHRLDLPMGFDRVVPYGTDDPAVFGTTQPADDTSRSGTYAFRFELDGHSMAARTRPGMIPVRPGTDLEVSTWVRMRDVQHAGVRLVAWLADADGRRVGSPVTSSCIEDAPDWTRLDVVVEGRTLHATELVVELQTLQLGHRPDVQSILPPPIDVHGQVHFDDVVIMQRPSIRLDDGRRHGLHPHGTTPTLQLHLFDPIPEPVQWTLVIEDDDGTVLARHAGSIPNGESTLRIDAPCPTRGWYRANLTATTTQGLRAEDVLDFVVLAPGDDAPGTAGTLHLTHWPTDDDIRLASALGVGSISLPFVDADGRPASADEALRTRLDAYLDRGGALEFHLETLPSRWCSELALDCRQLNDFTEQAADRWKPLVDDVAVHWGPAATRWRLGGDADARTAARWQSHLGTLIPDAVVTESGAREDDLIQSLRASTIRITAPWTTDQRGRMRPTRDFIAHHTVLQALRDRRSAGMIRIAPDTEGWVLEGSDRSDALLVHRRDGAPDTNGLALGDAAYRVDMNGNEWRLDTQDGTKTWTTADTPFIIEAGDDRLLRLQRDLQLQPIMLPARPRRHAHRVQVSNPTETTMRGTLRFTDAGRIQVDPPLLQIELAPHERRLLDVELLVTGPLPLGPHAIEAMLHLQQPAGDRIPVRCWTEVGLPELEVDVTSTPTVDGPLDVTIRIHNHGDTTRHLDARLVGDGTGTLPDQRIIVGPGETSGHRFLVHVDPATDAERSIHAQIAEVRTSGCVQIAITLPETMELATVDPLDP